MKRENVFIACMTFAGALTGLLITAVLMAIAIPGYNNFLLTLGEKQQFNMMEKATEWLLFVQKVWIMVPLSVLIWGTALVLFIRVLNPRIRAGSLKNIKAALKICTAIVLVFVVLPVLTGELKGILGIHSGALTILSPGQAVSWSSELVLGILYHTFVTYGLQFGVVWILIGEKGWLGELSSWKMPSGVTQRENLLTFASGGIFGAGMAITLMFQNWFFGRFFVLVSEVLDGFGETSFAGFVYFLIELVLMFGVFALIFAGLAVALAPVDRDMAYRKRKLVMPVTAFVVMTVFMFAYYGYASSRYDLHKENLAEAVGIPNKASESMTVIVMDSGENRRTPFVFEMPLQITAWGMASDNDIEVSQENLEKIERYLNDNPQGSVFQYTARDALYKGYNILGDMEKGLEFQYKASAYMLSPRLQLMNRLSHLPVTEKNIEYLNTFTDETRWYVSGKYSLRLAKALIHQNRFEEARKWIGRVREQGVSPDKKEEVIIPGGPVLTDGRITGVMSLNGTTPEDMKVMLFYDEGYPVANKIDSKNPADYLADNMNVAMGMRLVGLKATNGKGRFSFERLGSGNYSLVIMTTPGIVPYDTTLQHMVIKNNPGLITLDTRKQNADLGTIDISIRK